MGVAGIRKVPKSITNYLNCLLLLYFSVKNKCNNEVQFNVSSDEFVRIHLNFDFSNFKVQIRLSNLVEFDFHDQIRLS